LTRKKELRHGNWDGEKEGNKFYSINEMNNAEIKWGAAFA
jgi:hypothetical protein